MADRAGREHAGGLSPAPGGYPIKLVRDRTAEIVNPSGEPGELTYGAGASDRLVHQRLLRLKLAEEVGEYLVDGAYSELLDVLAVVFALGRLRGHSVAELVEHVEADPRGGFYKGQVMYGRHAEFDK